jgi:isocitrate lyase
MPIVLKEITEAQLKSFIWDLAKEGYALYTNLIRLWKTYWLLSFVFQLISLAGLHSGAVATGKSQHCYRRARVQ